MSIESICGNCTTGDHEACHDGLVLGLIGGWYCGCDHSPEADAKRHARIASFLPPPPSPVEPR